MPRIEEAAPEPDRGPTVDNAGGLTNIGPTSSSTPREKIMDDQTRIELEAAAFRSLVDHLRKRTDVQNIDLMTLSGFCRNCLSRWYSEAAAERGIEIDYERARALVYGMPYSEFKKKHHKEASPEQIAAMKEAQARAGH